MKKETLKELGKGFIGFSNLVGGLSIVNALFGAAQNLPSWAIAILVTYIISVGYIVGTILIQKGADDD